jgi:transposase InsO family protein
VQNWTLTTDFYLVAVRDAMTHNGAPDIFNTDQGCWFTSQEFTGLLTQRHIDISMDGLGCRRDHVFVERLFQPLDSQGNGSRLRFEVPSKQPQPPHSIPSNS